MFNHDRIQEIFCPFINGNCNKDCAALIEIDVVIEQNCECGWKEEVNFLEKAPARKCSECNKQIIEGTVESVLFCGRVDNHFDLAYPYLKKHVEFLTN